MKSPFRIATLSALLLIAIVVFRQIAVKFNGDRRAAQSDHVKTTADEKISYARRDSGTNNGNRGKTSEASHLPPADSERVRDLEKLRKMPEGADYRDWLLAERIEWWGKRLDPKIFWRGRVVWLDRSATLEANQHGRAYPPIPYDDPSLSRYGDVDLPYSGSVDGPNIRFRRTERERAFWGKFVTSHPRPPDAIAEKQLNIAERTLAQRDRYEKRGNPAQTSPAELERMLNSEIRDAAEMGFPRESFNEEALFWAYVMNRRTEYQRLIENGFSSDSGPMQATIDHLFVDPKFIRDAPSAEDLKSANAWKAAYLQLLRQEKTDESYINAYLQAWNLSPADISSAPNNP